MEPRPTYSCNVRILTVSAAKACKCKNGEFATNVLLNCLVTVIYIAKTFKILFEKVEEKKEFAVQSERYWNGIY